jgi:hypothetical protein
VSLSNTALIERVAYLLHAARQKGSARTLLLTDLAHPWALALEGETASLVEADLKLSTRSFDGLWCSFTAAYFVNFGDTLAQRYPFLKPRAWVCIIEIVDLLGHE